MLIMILSIKKFKKYIKKIIMLKINNNGINNNHRINNNNRINNNKFNQILILILIMILIVILIVI